LLRPPLFLGCSSRGVSSRNPADFFDPNNCVRFRPDTRFYNPLERCVLGRRRFFVLSNGLHIVDPSGQSFWKMFFFIAVIVVSIVTGQAEITGMAAAILSAGTVTAATVEGAAIDRLAGSATASSTAGAAPSSPGLSATARQAIASPDPGALPHPIPESGPVLLGTPIAEPGRTSLVHPSDTPGNQILPHPVDSPQPGILVHPLLNKPQPLHDALNVSNPPNPKDEGHNTPKGRRLAPHAQQRPPGQITPSPEEIDQAIDRGQKFPSSRVAGREVYYDPITNTTVVTESGGDDVVTARRGPPSGIGPR